MANLTTVTSVDPLETCTDQLNEVTKDLVSLKGQFKDKVSDLDTCNTQSAKLKTDIEALKGEKSEVEGNVKSLESKLAKRNHDFEKKRKELIAKEERWNLEMSSQRHSHKQELEAMRLAHKKEKEIWSRNLAEKEKETRAMREKFIEGMANKTASNVEQTETEFEKRMRLQEERMKEQEKRIKAIVGNTGGYSGGVLSRMAEDQQLKIASKYATDLKFENYGHFDEPRPKNTFLPLE